MASTAALSAASQDRKSRLAQLKSLKRKQEVLQDDSTAEELEHRGDSHDARDNADLAQEGTNKYISGRNYDFETKGAKLGFESAPNNGKATLEQQAALLQEEVMEDAAEDEKEDKPLDLFKLQPKKPNWDLKRDLQRKLDVLNVRTDNAIARLVRERIAKQQAAAKATLNGSLSEGDADAAGIEGTTLVEATKEREREDEEDARREREEDEALLDVP